MSRPQSIDDIPERVPRSIQFASINIGVIADNPKLVTAYRDFLVACRAAACAVDTSYRDIRFTRPPTQDDLCAALKEAQAAWDAGQTLYEKWAQGGQFDDELSLMAAKEHAIAEGLTMFTWEKEGNQK